MIVFRVTGGPVFGKNDKYKVGDVVENKFVTTCDMALMALAIWNMVRGNPDTEIAVIECYKWRRPTMDEKCGIDYPADLEEKICIKGKVLKVIKAKRLIECFKKAKPGLVRAMYNKYS